jgi:UDP-glucuronate 4-epimerase
MSKKSYTYLVTGAAGFIGSYLCRALLRNVGTNKVIGIDNVNNYYNREIKQRRIKELAKNSRFIFYKTSILEKKSIFDIVTRQKPNILVHAAAGVGVRNGEAHPSEYFSTNVVGTVNLLEATAPHIRHAIVFSSSSVYGSTKHLPFRETELLFPSTPLSTYGASKLAMEIAVQNFYKRTGIPTTIVRPFSIYGPDGRPDMLPMKLLISAKKNIPIEIFAPTTTSRDWTYIDDCVHMLCAILKKPNGLQIVNIASGHPVPLDETVKVSQKIIRQYGHIIQFTTKPANPTEMKKTWADTTKTKRLVKPFPLTNYEEGFKKTADFFFSHLNLYDL